MGTDPTYVPSDARWKQATSPRTNWHISLTFVHPSTEAGLGSVGKRRDHARDYMGCDWETVQYTGPELQERERTATISARHSAEINKLFHRASGHSG